MNRRWLATGTLATAALAALWLTPAPADQGPEPRQLVRLHCTVCHTLKRVRAHVGVLSQDEWLSYLGRMQKHGAKLNDAEKEVVAAWLGGLTSGKDI
ncbi:MAG: hypothetical protein KQJ78_15580 [Deltaproteobacteria bacterium]|nr:hypothetical protein [Deltaproteobacteria bacterium]